MHIFAKEDLQEALGYRSPGEDILPKRRMFNKDHNNESESMLTMSNGRRPMYESMPMSPKHGSSQNRENYVNENTYIDFDRVEQIRGCKEMRHRAREQIIKES